MSVLTVVRRRIASVLGVGGMLVSLLVVAVGTAAPASADQKPECSGAKDKVVDVTRSLLNAADFGADGHVWALDSYLEHIQIWQLGEHYYCARLDDTGTFTTFAGVSPNLTGTVSSGVTGSFVGARVIYFTAEFAPVAPVSGYLGEFDFDCHQDGTCAARVRLIAMYFTNGFEHVRFGWFAATFDGGTHGTWSQNLDGNFGDITG